MANLLNRYDDNNDVMNDLLQRMVNYCKVMRIRVKDIQEALCDPYNDLNPFVMLTTERQMLPDFSQAFTREVSPYTISQKATDNADGSHTYMLTIH